MCVCVFGFACVRALSHRQGKGFRSHLGSSPDAQAVHALYLPLVAPVEHAAAVAVLFGRLGAKQACLVGPVADTLHDEGQEARSQNCAHRACRVRDSVVHVVLGMALLEEPLELVLHLVRRKLHDQRAPVVPDREPVLP
jgi:hypothetical protein